MRTLKIFLSCATLWLFPYGVFIMAVEATSILVLFNLFVLSLATTIFLIKNSIPPPEQSIVDEILNVDDGVWAHRFAAIDAPENTLVALEKCYKNGAKGVEFDVVMTSDFVPVVFHDTKLNRITGKEDDIRTVPYNQIKNLDVSVNHPFKEEFPNTCVPLLDDVVDKCVQYDMRMFIDIKDDRAEVVQVILNLYKKHPILYKRAIVSSFNPYIIYCIRRANPSIIGSLAWRPFYFSYSNYSPDKSACVPFNHNILMVVLSRICDIFHEWFYNNLAHHLLGFSTALIQKDNLTWPVVEYWDERNVRVVAWTVNSPLEKQHFSKTLKIHYITDTMMGK